MANADCPCFNLGLAHRRVARAYEEALADLGLTIAQVHFLSCLYERDGRHAKEIARQLGVDAGTLTPMIDRMERQGLVRRCPCPEDRRAAHICLEPAGAKLRPAIESRCQAVGDRLAARVRPDDYETFRRVLWQLAVASEETRPDVPAATGDDHEALQPR